MFGSLCRSVQGCRLKTFDHSIDTYLIIFAKLEFQFDGLFQALESPFAFLFFQGRDTQELPNRLFRAGQFHLFGIVVFILDIDVTGVFVVVFLVLEVVPTCTLVSCHSSSARMLAYCSSSDSCIKSSSSDILICSPNDVQRGRNSRVDLFVGQKAFGCKRQQPRQPRLMWRRESSDGARSSGVGSIDSVLCAGVRTSPANQRGRSGVPVH